MIAIVLSTLCLLRLHIGQLVKCFGSQDVDFNQFVSNLFTIPSSLLRLLTTSLISRLLGTVTISSVVAMVVLNVPIASNVPS